MSKVIDLSFLDSPEPKPDVTVNLDFLDREEKDKQTYRDIQRERYPSDQELGYHNEAVKPWSVGTMVKTAASDLNPMNLVHMIAHPMDTAEALGKAREHSETEAGKAWSEGNYTAALSRGFLNMIPVVGPMAANMGEEAGTNPSAGVGHIGAAIAGEALGGKVAGMAGDFIDHPIAGSKELINKITSAPGAVRDAVSNVRDSAVDFANRKIAPEDQIMKALRPKNSNLDFGKDAKVAMQHISQSAEDIGRPVTDLESLDVAKEHAISTLVDQQKKIVGAGAAQKINGQGIADAIKSAVPKLFRNDQPDIAADIDAWADKTYGKDFTIDELNEFRKDANAGMSGYYNSKMPNQQMALDRTLDTAIGKAKAGAIRKTLVDGLNDKTGGGDALAQVNGGLKSLLTVGDAMDRRWNVEQRQAVQNLPQQVSKLLAFNKFGKAARALMTGSPGGAAVEALTGLGEAGVANFMRELNSTNGQIASAFRRFDERPAPLTFSTPSAAPTQQMLGAATGPNGQVNATVQPQTATGAATPGSASAQSQWQQPGSIKLPRQMAVTKDPATGRFASRDLLDLSKFLEQEKAAGRTGLASQRPVSPAEEAPVDVDYVSKPTYPMPASSIEQKALPVGSGQQAGSTVREAPESSLTSRDLLNVKNATSYIGRDPKTGQFKKVFTGEPMNPADMSFTDRLKKLWNDETGSVRIGGDDSNVFKFQAKDNDTPSSLGGGSGKVKPFVKTEFSIPGFQLPEGLSIQEVPRKQRYGYSVLDKDGNSRGYGSTEAEAWEQVKKLAPMHKRSGPTELKVEKTDYGENGFGVVGKKNKNYVSENDSKEDALAEYFANYADEKQKHAVMKAALKAGWSGGSGSTMDENYTAHDFSKPSDYPKAGKSSSSQQLREAADDLADQAFDFLISQSKKKK